MNNRLNSFRLPVFGGALAMLCFGVWTGVGRGASIAYQSNISPASSIGGPGYFIGTRFTVGAQNLIVTSEGTWNESTTSSTAATVDSIPVGIYLYTDVASNPLDTLVAGSNVTVPSGTAATDYIASVAPGGPIVLLAGQTYDVAASAPGGFLSTALGTTYAVAPDVTLINGIYYPNAANSPLPASGSTFNISSNNDHYIGGTFSYTVAPEPASICLLGLGALSLLARRCRA